MAETVMISKTSLEKEQIAETVMTSTNVIEKRADS